MNEQFIPEMQLFDVDLEQGLSRGGRWIRQGGKIIVLLGGQRLSKDDELYESESSREGPVTETIWNWQRYGDKIPPGEQSKINKMADLIVSSFVPGSKEAPIRSVEVIGHADTDNIGTKEHRTAKERAVSKQRAFVVKDALQAAVRSLWTARKMGPPPVGGVAWHVVWKGATELIAGPYNRANRRVEVTLIRSGIPIPPPQADDTLETRIKRVLKLLETRQVIPDSSGRATQRARCILPKLLRRKVIDMFVDGGLANQTINGVTPKHYECRPPGRNVGYMANYDGFKKPMPNSEWFKFFGRVLPIIQGPGLAPTQSDDRVLEIVGSVINRIDLGVDIVVDYLGRNASASDHARWRLGKWIENGRENEDNIYSCYR